ncbi:MarR family winged helix-turn-helix transcriptional regulator [Levilactobacillus spicheri]|uniref:HTH marR-type domain-containing protein n=1 Tax=Levilactobacillus spicheri TaxID=216463 RepID=A0A0F3RRS2_9LACO|nr:MarR family winged helix-turn-helix transcriptional regulator [Levilactobacillus spicheri]KJW12600.1 hypothetical protein VC81_08990 [Levilactobacillus spicheri]
MTQPSDLNNLMRSIQMKEQHLYYEQTADYQLSPSQGRALIYIDKHPGVNQKELAERFRLRGASVSTLIKKLVALDYVEKRPSRGSQDRSNRLYLTAAGTALVAQLQTIFTGVENRLVAHVTPEEVATLIRILSKIDQKLIE